MPRVPSVGLSPTSRPQFQAPGVVAFQGGPELQQIARGGARLERIGQIVGQIGIEIEDKVNDARAMEATNAFENSANRLLFEYRQKKGKDAVEARAELDQQMKELRDGAGGMLLNDTQRIQFNRIADKIGSRSSLAFDEHYAKAAAEDKQEQNLARQVVLSDSLANNDIGPQSIVAFGQFNNLVREEGEARGLSGDALEVFALGKRDQLLQSIVTQKLDSEDPAQIMQVEGLLDSLPDGVISQTQKQSLTKLISKKSRDSRAIQFAAKGVQDDMTFSDGINKITEIAKDDPELAEAMLDKWSKFKAAQDKAESEERGNLMMSLSEKLSRGESLSADDIAKASKAGIYDELQLVEARLDVTDDYGESVVNELYRNPQAIIARYGDDEGTVGRMMDELKAHVSQETLRVLAGQYNAYKSEQVSSSTTTGSGSRSPFDPFSATDSDVTENMLFQLDSLNVKDGKTVDDQLEIAYGKDRAARRTRVRNLMINRFHIDVMKRANAKLKLMQPTEKIDRTALVQEAAREVYESGWLNPEHTRNLYTTEFRYQQPGKSLSALMRPMRRDELEPYQDQAAKELIEEERGAAIQKVFDQFIPDQFVLNRQELELRASREILGIPGMTPAMLAERDAAQARVESTISPVDIDARAETLRQQDLERKAIETGEHQAVVRTSTANKLMTQKAQSVELLYTYGRGFTTSRGFVGRGTFKTTAAQRRQMFLDAVEEAKAAWTGSGMSEESFEEFALMFYPGNDKDLPKVVLDKLRNVPRSTDDGRTMTRLEAVRRFYLNR